MSEKLRENPCVARGDYEATHNVGRGILPTLIQHYVFLDD